MVAGTQFRNFTILCRYYKTLYLSSILIDKEAVLEPKSYLIAAGLDVKFQCPSGMPINPKKNICVFYPIHVLFKAESRFQEMFAGATNVSMFYQSYIIPISVSIFLCHSLMTHPTYKKLTSSSRESRSWSRLAFVTNLQYMSASLSPTSLRHEREREGTVVNHRERKMEDHKLRH